MTDSTSRPAQLTGARRCGAEFSRTGAASVHCPRGAAVSSAAALGGRVAGAGAGSQSVV